MSLRPAKPLRSVFLSALCTLLACVAVASAAPREKVIYTFNPNKGEGGSLAALDIDSAGNLYGISGVAFELSPSGRGWTETDLYSFGGFGSSAPLIVDQSGNLYGTTTNGGAHDYGTAFELSPGSNGWTEDVLHSFDLVYHGTDGAYPWAGLVMDETGNLYGVTREGGYNGVAGVAFELTPGSDGWSEQVIHDFGRRAGDAGEAYFAPVFDKTEQHLFGTGEYGGPDDLGAVFEISRTTGGGWKERVLHSFQGQSKGDGALPYGGLVFDRAGNLYGTTTEGGPTGQGTVFKLTPAAHGRWKETILYAFPDCSMGCYPQGTLAIDKSGAFYGIGGGGNDCDGVACGLIFKLAPHPGGKWKYGVLYKFTGSDGEWPQGGVILDKSEKHLYGATEYGGAYGYGVVFEITP